MTCRQMNDLAAPIWKQYAQGRTVALRNRLVEIYLPLVAHAARGLRESSVTDMEDYQADGVLGLMAAIEAYDSSRGVSFTTFAPLRIRGAIVDAIRNVDFVPRQQRAKAKKDSAHRLRELVNESDSLELNGGTRSKLEGVSQPGEALQRVLQEEFWEQATRTLTKQGRVITLLYFRDGLTLSRIGELLALSESRISQIMTKSIMPALRGHLQNQEREQLKPREAWRMAKRLKSKDSGVPPLEHHSRDDIETNIVRCEQELAAWQELKRLQIERQQPSKKTKPNRRTKR